MRSYIVIVPSLFPDEAGLQVLKAVSGYRQLAYDWAEKIVGQTQRRFEAYASGYRAQVGRMVGSQELPSDKSRLFVTVSTHYRASTKRLGSESCCTP
jgi:hypothetical protein